MKSQLKGPTIPNFSTYTNSLGGKKRVFYQRCWDTRSMGNWRISILPILVDCNETSVACLYIYRSQKGSFTFSDSTDAA